MSRLLDLRERIVEAIKARLPTWDVAGHLGRFRAADLTSFLTKAPAVRVAVLGFSDPLLEEDGLIRVRAKLGVYIATKDQGAKLSRDEAGVAAAEAISLLVAGSRFGVTYVRDAAAPSGQNLFSDETLKLGVALWALDWDQEVLLDAQPDAQEGDPLKALFIGLSPDIGPGHEDDYIGPIPEAADA